MIIRNRTLVKSLILLLTNAVAGLKSGVLYSISLHAENGVTAVVPEDELRNSTSDRIQVSTGNEILQLD